MKFEQMNLIRPILRAIREVGYTEPTPIQQKTIPPLLNGKDVLGCAQTGTGKTAAFALPILQRIARAEDFDPAATARPIRALILTPTRELALQIYENFVGYGKYLPVRCAVIFGGVNQNPQVEQLRAGVDILVATPGRLNDLIGQGHISLRDIRIFVLDEADRMLDMGFIHEVRKVMAKLPAQRQTLLFSATMPPQVEEIAEQLLTNPVNIKISPVTSTVDSVDQSVYFLAKSDKIRLLLYLLNGHGVSNALVFTRTKHGADQVARLLNKNHVKALAIHGNKSQNARQTALSQFKSGQIDVLVATDIAARGIDIAELPTVINYNVPEEPETYIHRIGRTGRAGLDGVAITFCCSDELESFRDIEKLIGRKVSELICEWSVADMQPTKPERKQPNARPSRIGQGNAESPKQQPAKQETSAKQQPAKQETSAKQQPAKQETSAKQQPAKQEKPAKQQPAKQEKPAKQQPVKQETSAKQQPAKQEKPAKQQPAKQEKPAKQQPVKQEKPAKQQPAKQQPAKQEKPAKQQPVKQEKPAKQQPTKQEQPAASQKRETENREAGKNRSRRPDTASVGKRSGGAADREPQRPSSVSTKPTEVVDRRYADSGEHDGATGQQIVTNFNRSVWLEFNEPPKRSAMPWRDALGQKKEPAQPERREPKPTSAPKEPVDRSDGQESPKRRGFFLRRKKK